MQDISRWKEVGVVSGHNMAEEFVYEGVIF
jgi:hypothetical protein